MIPHGLQHSSITLATARYADRQLADEDYDSVWSARAKDEFDHTAVAVVTKKANGKLDIDRHDSTTKHLAWAGAALAVVTPGLGLAVGAGGGAIVGHFHHNIPKDKVREAGSLLESGEAGLIIVAVNKKGTDIARCSGTPRRPRSPRRLPGTWTPRSTRSWRKPGATRAGAEQPDEPRGRRSRRPRRGGGVTGHADSDAAGARAGSEPRTSAGRGTALGWGPRLGVWAWSFVGVVVAITIVLFAVAAVSEIMLPLTFAAVLAVCFRPRRGSTGTRGPRVSAAAASSSCSSRPHRPRGASRPSGG